MCGLRTRPRTDVDPPQVELLSAGVGAYRLATPGAILMKQIQLGISIRSLRIVLLRTVQPRSPV